MMRIAQQKEFISEYLSTYQTDDEAEKTFVQQVIDFINAQENPFNPYLQAGHITVSSILLDQKKNCILFHYHVKLDRWLQFGGHVEPEQDFNPLQAAIRELMEETGLSVTAFSILSGEPMDVDVHLIPARADFPEHPHYDLRYVFQLILPAKFDEQNFRWIPLSELVNWPDLSVARFAKKILATIE